MVILFILILLFWILEELQYIQKLLLSSDQLFDPTAVFVIEVEFVWRDTSLNVCALQKTLVYVCGHLGVHVWTLECMCVFLVSPFLSFHFIRVATNH